MVSTVIILAIMLAIAIGYKFGYNTGVLGMGFAYVIGCFILNMAPSDVIAGWPIKTMFVILAVSLFYNISLANGTLQKFAQLLLYHTQKFPHLLPYALYFAAALIAMMGAGFFAVMAFMIPITMMICREAKLSPVIGAMSVNCGALSGANFMISGSGVIFRGLMEDAGFKEQAFQQTWLIFVLSVIFSLILITIIQLFVRRQKQQIDALDIQRPDAFTKKQRQTFILILVMMLVVLLPPLLKYLFPQVAFIAFINSKMDIGLVAVLFAIIGIFMKLAAEKDVFQNIPWHTIVMISGMGMLINVAIEAGTVKQLSAWINTGVPVFLIPILLAFIGAVMSFFSSTLGVVAPTLFPMVPVLATATGLNPGILFASIVIGAQSSAISPFSSGGSLTLGAISDPNESQNMFRALMFRAVPTNVCFALIFVLLIGLFA